MSIDADHELLSFHNFVTHQLQSGDELSPEEVLDAWRMQNPSPQQYQEDVEAVREALADMKAGDRGIPVDRFRSEFRKRHGLNGTS